MLRASSHLRRTLAIAVLLPLVVFAVSFAHDRMRCRFTGVVVPACACPDDAPPAGAALVEQSCCERQTLEAISVAREEVSVAALSPPTLVQTLTDFPPAARPPGRTSATFASFRPAGPALVLLKRSFLI